MGWGGAIVELAKFPITTAQFQFRGKWLSSSRNSMWIAPNMRTKPPLEHEDGGASQAIQLPPLPFLGEMARNQVYCLSFLFALRLFPLRPRASAAPREPQQPPSSFPTSSSPASPLSPSPTLTFFLLVMQLSAAPPSAVFSHPFRRGNSGNCVENVSTRGRRAACASCTAPACARPIPA